MNSKEKRDRAEMLLQDELLMDVISDLTEEFIQKAFSTSITNEERGQLVHQKRGMDIVLARLTLFINEYEVQKRESLHQNP